MIKFLDKKIARLNYDHGKLKQLCRAYRIYLVIFHGSQVNGNVNKESDIDVGILGDKPFIQKHFSDIVGKFSEIFNGKCDLVILNKAESLIAYQVAVKGIPLYEVNKGIFAEFQTMSISRYQDAVKFRRLEKQYLKTAIQRMK